MAGDSVKTSDAAADRNVKFCRHPYHSARYAAVGAELVHVEAESGEWGQFDRNGRWLDGPLRHADPIYCRWVTGEIIARSHFGEAKGVS